MWNKRTNTKGMFYNETSHSSYWGILPNLFSTFKRQFEYALANCTIECIGRQLENGRPMPVSIVKNANLWHTVVNEKEGWSLLNYEDGMQLKAGDIVEWKVNHVATIEEDGINPNCSASWWTDDNGKSSGTRVLGGVMGDSLQSLSDFFKSNFTNRFFHYVSFENECKNGGGNAKPLYVLRFKDGRDESKDQIYCKYVQNIRSGAGKEYEIVGQTNIGYYDVLETKHNDYLWCKTSLGWVAVVEGRVEYLSQEKDYKALYQKAQSKLDRIEAILNE